jgi:hypothetical protein
MFEQLIENLKKILTSIFGVLDAGFVADMLDDAPVELKSALCKCFEVRYGLFRPDVVELKTSVLFQTEKEADEIARMSGARVGIVLVPKR